MLLSPTNQPGFQNQISDIYLFIFYFFILFIIVY